MENKNKLTKSHIYIYIVRAEYPRWFFKYLKKEKFKDDAVYIPSIQQGNGHVIMMLSVAPDFS
jgi:hypothetical protein